MILGIVKLREVVAEHIQAKTLNIDGMYLGKMVTRQGDVAYHFMLKHDKDVFQEGRHSLIFQALYVISGYFFKCIEFCISNGFHCLTITGIPCDFFDNVF